MATPSQDPERQRAYQAAHRAKNPRAYADAQARFRAKHKERLAKERIQRRQALDEAGLKALRARQTAAKTASYRRLKDQVYAAYGGYECKCCGVTEPSFLSIDHLHNDGAQQRREIHGKTPSGLYAYLRTNRFPNGYQVLCMNCQVGKHRNGGVCPHQGKV